MKRFLLILTFFSVFLMANTDQIWATHWDKLWLKARYNTWESLDPVEHHQAVEFIITQAGIQGAIWRKGAKTVTILPDIPEMAANESTFRFQDRQLIQFGDCLILFRNFISEPQIIGTITGEYEGYQFGDVDIPETILLQLRTTIP